jgi:hypothetical protein
MFPSVKILGLTSQKLNGVEYRTCRQGSQNVERRSCDTYIQICKCGAVHRPKSNRHFHLFVPHSEAPAVGRDQQYFGDDNKERDFRVHGRLSFGCIALKDLGLTPLDMV